MKGMVAVEKINEMNELIKDLNKRLENIEASSSQRNVLPDKSTKETIFQYDDNVLQSEAQMVGEDNELNSDDASPALQLDELNIENMIVMDFINGHPFEDLVLSSRDLNVSEVVVDELIVKNHKNYVEIMKKLGPEDMIASASENIAAPMTDGVVQTLNVNSLVVDGFINRLDLAMLNEFALKLRGDQILESEINFELLRAVSLQASGEISGKKISHVVRTVNDGKSFTVDQTIQFANPVFINELIVNRRINNINVVKGGVNILLKRSDHDQVIEAMKIFDEVKLLNPIVLQGKITKSNLNKINPIVSFTNDIVLEGKNIAIDTHHGEEINNKKLFSNFHLGDYVIQGNTTISRTISGENFYGSGGVYNAIDLLADGLRLNTSVIEQIFEFVQPIKVTNLLSNSVNNVDVSKFIRTGEVIQTVYGEKNFTGDLHVTNGACDALTINGIDLSTLSESVLKRSGAQTIEGKINFNAVRVKR